MRTRRLGDYAAAGIIAALAFVISPWGIELATGRADLSFRVTASSFVLAVFLATISAAVLAQGRMRRFFFAIIGWTLPLAALACLEGAAIAVHLADRVAPLEDTSILAHGANWPAHLLSEARWQPGEHLYRPWQGPGISLNALGLRAPPPTPKAAGEWRIAVTGGSSVWGWRVLDADTIPVQLQDLARATNPKLSVFNFGIEGATVAQELVLLKRFRDAYGLDQAIFYTGGNDVLLTYLDVAGAGRKNLFDAPAGLTSFELIKAAARFAQTMSDPSAAALDRLKADMLPRVQRSNSLRAGLAAAEDYCTATKLRCDFVLQPLLFTRAHPVGPELRLVRTFRRLYPGLAAVVGVMYRDTLAALPPDRIHDLSAMFDSLAQPVFTDNIHVNEKGNRIAAERILAAVPFGPR